MSSAKKNDDSYLKREGLINANEQFETIYLAEEEIEKFMEKYMLENPDTEIETRYLNQSPIEVIQDIQVRWLRPETPEIPPIIIKEVADNSAKHEQPTIRIVQTQRKQQKHPQKPQEPMIIRERPPVLPIPSPKFAYVQNVIKRQKAPSEHNPTTQSISHSKEIKVEHVRSESNLENALPQPLHQPNFSFEEHHSVIEDEAEEEYGLNRFSNNGVEKSLISIDGIYQMRSDLDNAALEDEQQLRLYEEKLKQTLYEEYLLRMEREKLEKKLTESGLFDQRIRERSNSHDRCSSLLSSGRFSESLINNQGYVSQLERENKQKQHLSDIRSRVQQLQQKQAYNLNNNNSQLNESFGSGSETSTYKNIKFSKVVDKNELKRLNAILTNPNSPSITNKHEGDRIMSSFEDGNYIKNNQKQPNQQEQMMQRKVYNSSNDIFTQAPSNLKSHQLPPRMQTERKFLDDVRAYEAYNNGIKNQLSQNGSYVRPNNDMMSRSGSGGTGGGGGFRRQKITSVNRYYCANNPNPITDTVTDITSYKY